MIPAAALLLLAFFGDWPQFRGPNGSGVSDSTGLPLEFGPDKNVVWKTSLPPGHSSPVVTARQIFVTAVDGETLLTMCLDRATGKILWRRAAPRPRVEIMQAPNTPVSGSPVTDGQNVYAFFGDFGLISYTSDGAERWRLPLGPFNNQNGHGSSPILAGGLLILICDQDTDSYLLAVDPASGKVRWKTPRPETTRGYATPAVYTPKNGPPELIVPGAFLVESYRLSTGTRLWWVRGMAWQLKSVPVIAQDYSGGDVIYVSGWETGGATAQPPNILGWKDALARYDKNHDGFLSREEGPFKNDSDFHDTDLDHNGRVDEREWNFYGARRGSRNNIVAIRPGGRGDVTETHVLWRYGKSIPNTTSPLLYGGAIFLMKEGGILTTLDPQTGVVQKQARLAGALGQYWSSPVGADGKVYVASEEGKISIVRAQPQWEVVQENDVDDTTFATPAIVEGRIYLRTMHTLYCFGVPARE